MIWLVDYTHYKKNIDSKLSVLKEDYFRIKSYWRFKRIGQTAPVKTRVFSTGLLRIATILKRAGHNVRYLHSYMLDDLLNELSELPETIAFSCVCPTVPLCAKLAERIKRTNRSTRLLLGGIHVNVAYSETKKRFPIFDELIDGFEYEAAAKIVGGVIKRSPLDDGCYVDYSLLPYELKEYAINTFSNMGCPFHCAYCVDGRSPHFEATPDGQLGEMKKLLPEKTLIHFFDSVFGYSKQGIKRICSAIEKTNHNFILSCDMRAELLDPDILKRMEGAGFREIRLGVESSDNELLLNNERTLSIEVFQKQLEMINNNSNMYITLYSVTGLPGTTEKSHLKTLEYFDHVLSSDMVDEIKNALYVPYPMSGVDYAKRGIFILNEDWACYDRQSYPVYRTDELSQREIWKLFLNTAYSINNSWLKRCKIKKVEDVPIIEGYYSEYVVSNYLTNKNGGEN